MRFLCSGLSFILLAAGISFGVPSAPPNIVLITLDTTRADRMGFLGSRRGLTPHLDAVAKQGVVFTRAYAHVPLTTASHATILTGTYPQFNHVNDFGKPLAEHLPYLPDILHHHGYHTAAFVGSLILDPLDGLAPGFDRGFDVYDAGFRLRRAHEDRYKTVERRADEVICHALTWLGNNPKRPFFLWIHLYDAHDPYDPPPPYAQRYAALPYDGEIAYVDAAVGHLLTVLRGHKLYDGTLIAIMADHGEAFGEHGERTHGIFLYDETIHVPLLFKLPHERFAGKRISTQTGLVDVTPTILKVAGLQAPSAVQGEPLLSLMQTQARVAAGMTSAPTGNATHADRPVYSETDYPHRAFGWSSLRSLREGKYLFIEAPRRELYDQNADPKELHNLADNRPAVAGTLTTNLDKFRVSTSAAQPGGRTVNAQQAQKLNALGYVASDASPGEAPGKSGKTSAPDPKDKIEIANQMHAAIMEMEDGRYQEAIPRLEEVLAGDTNMPIAQMQLGTAFTRIHDYQKAVPALQRALVLQPDSGMGHYELGLALFETGDWQGAAPQFEFAVKQAPRWADAHFSLGSVYARIDRVPEALTQLHTALQLNPHHYRANLLLGRILFLQGHAREALPNLREAADVEPKSREAHLFLADAYTQLGMSAAAQRERAQAQRLPPPVQQ
ncbi:MAG TPA: sulfatase-like hydrolase/transferase [Terriglobales bacterium]|nr:sulfatase-like hydrolase/transferase [Terriglobales bacterium]